MAVNLLSGYNMLIETSYVVPNGDEALFNSI